MRGDEVRDRIRRGKNDGEWLLRCIAAGVMFLFGVRCRSRCDCGVDLAGFLRFDDSEIGVFLGTGVFEGEVAVAVDAHMEA